MKRPSDGPVFKPHPNRSLASRQLERAALFFTEPRVSLMALLLAAATGFVMGFFTR